MAGNLRRRAAISARCDSIEAYRSTGSDDGEFFPSGRQWNGTYRSVEYAADVTEAGVGVVFAAAPVCARRVSGDASDRDVWTCVAGRRRLSRDNRRARVSDAAMCATANGAATALAHALFRRESWVHEQSADPLGGPRRGSLAPRLGRTSRESAPGENGEHLHERDPGPLADLRSRGPGTLQSREATAGSRCGSAPALRALYHQGARYNVGPNPHDEATRQIRCRRAQ